MERLTRLLLPMGSSMTPKRCGIFRHTTSETLQCKKPITTKRPKICPSANHYSSSKLLCFTLFSTCYSLNHACQQWQGGISNRRCIKRGLHPNGCPEQRFGDGGTLRGANFSFVTSIMLSLYPNKARSAIRDGLFRLCLARACGGYRGVSGFSFGIDLQNRRG
jgi:hypothetical protein